MPVTHAGRDLQDVALSQNLRRLTFFLIESHAAGNHHDHAAVPMPGAVSSRGKGNVVGGGEVELRIRLNQGLEISLAGKGRRRERIPERKGQFFF